ncbi:MAG: mitochondrial fission ELM1 family protein [Planctomycetaceae bacterium]
MANDNQRLTIWSIQDDKPGHRNQVRGLIRALSERVDVDVYPVSPPPVIDLLTDLLFKKLRRNSLIPRPALIVGAGHATHLAILAAGRATGAKTVVIMKPTLPRQWFDLCIMPAHDMKSDKDRQSAVANALTTENHDSRVQASSLLVTRGALNAVVPSTRHEPNRGLFLIGGTSSHYRWSNQDVFERVVEIVAREPSRMWTLTTSRRTPSALIEQLCDLRFPKLQVFRSEDTSPDWLPAQLQRSSATWVTEESVSMVYEALTAGGAVGLLPVPRRKSTRVSRGIDVLLAEGWVTSFAEWKEQGTMSVPPARLSEADRCAAWILDRWFTSISLNARQQSQQQVA